MVGFGSTSSRWPIIGHAIQIERLRRMVAAGQYPLAILMTGTPGVSCQVGSTKSTRAKDLGHFITPVQ